MGDPMEPTQPVLRLAFLIALLPLFIEVSVCPVAGQVPGYNLALALRDNVVAIRVHHQSGESPQGFGIIVGRSNDDIYIATANHIVTLKNKTQSALTAATRPPE